MDYEMEFEWVITMIWQEETVWANNSRKVTFVVEEDSDREFKSSVAVDLRNEKADLIKDYKVWDKVKVWLNFRAREYNGRWFNGITAWRMDKTSWSNSASSNATDDLPF